jgi:transcription elongation factor Elf1
MNLLSLDVQAPNLWYQCLARVKFKRALVDMNAELKILCPECGAMNTVNVDPSTRVKTAFCKECEAELHLILKRSRPASFAP